MSHQRRENAGKIALQRGPIVYCLEEIDNGVNLQLISLVPTHSLTPTYDPTLLEGVVAISGEATRIKEEDWDNELYRPDSHSTSTVTIKAIPYFAWCNRTPGEMRVWINER
ncbi:hypothetical protein [Halalkalibacter urbisdiaboli]|uniref:hypothetical protein n=1 Tax=Halalkalibacter urbisdiaboli TaxID=1960589 RepID=UPI001FD94825|nr:hypothetical protein [Halalkalibacter urbisdiaboli]